MKHQTIELTPDIASELLRHNTNNRPMSKNLVRQYADAMRKGHWRENGDTITIDVKGKFIDGQHRCAAVIASGATITVILVTEVPEDAFMTKDAGKKRSTGDALAIAGEKHGNVLASAAKAYKQTKTRQIVRVLTSAEASELIAITPSLRFWASLYASNLRARKLFISSLAGALCAGSEVYGHDAMLDLFAKLETGEGLAAGEPALVLRDRLIQQKGGQSFTKDYELCLYIKTISAHGQNKKIKVLRMLPDEPSVPSLN